MRCRNWSELLYVLAVLVFEIRWLHIAGSWVSSSPGIRHGSPCMSSDTATYRSYVKDARVPRKVVDKASLHSSIKCSTRPLWAG
jgi:hypothetical protein